jgi:hypothetical protein
MLPPAVSITGELTLPRSFLTKLDTVVVPFFGNSGDVENCTTYCTVIGKAGLTADWKLNTVGALTEALFVGEISAIRLSGVAKPRLEDLSVTK